MELMGMLHRSLSPTCPSVLTNDLSFLIVFLILRFLLDGQKCPKFNILKTFLDNTVFDKHMIKIPMSAGNLWALQYIDYGKSVLFMLWFSNSSPRFARMPAGEYLFQDRVHREESLELGFLSRVLVRSWFVYIWHRRLLVFF